MTLKEAKRRLKQFDNSRRYELDYQEKKEKDKLKSFVKNYRWYKFWYLFK